MVLVALCRELRSGNLGPRLGSIIFFSLKNSDLGNFNFYLKLISADRGLARNGGALKIYNNQLDSTNTVACEKLSNPNGGPTLTFQNFCQDLSQTDSPVPGTVPTGNGECVCPWNSDLNQESDLTYQ